MRIRLEAWFHPGEKEAITKASISAGVDFLRIEGIGCGVFELEEHEIREMEEILQMARINGTGPNK